MERGRFSVACVATVIFAATFAGCGHSGKTAASSTAVAPASVIASGQGTTAGNGAQSSSTTSLVPASVPHYAHIVVVVMENRGFSDVIGNPQAPYLYSLVQQGLSLTDTHAVAHPSQPNYLALFSGSTQQTTSDACPQTLSGPNLASELSAAGYTFIGYSESLPQPGYTGCSSGAYARKHNPWADYTDLPSSINQPFTAFPTDYNQLPTVSFVIPNLNHDMHDGTISQADQWLQSNLGNYVTWAYTHHSLLIVTWDEDDGTPTNQIPTILVGSTLLSGTDSTPSTHYTILRTIEASYQLPPLGASAATQPLTHDWQ